VPTARNSNTRVILLIKETLLPDAAIARECNISRERVRQLWQKHGDPEHSGKFAVCLSSKTADIISLALKAIDKANNEKRVTSLRIIARELGVDYSVVQVIATEHGKKLLYPGRSAFQRKVDLKTITEDIAAGVMSATELMAKYKISKRMVYIYLAKLKPDQYHCSYRLNKATVPANEKEL